jgi:hypothetical protein
VPDGLNVGGLAIGNDARYDFGVVTDFVLPEPDHDAAQLNEGAGFAFVIFVPFPRAVEVANRAAVPETASTSYTTRNCGR